MNKIRPFNFYQSLKGVILVLAICCFSSCLSTETTEKTVDNSSTNEVLVVAHRGDWRNYPENSLEAIQSCIDMGVDIVEIDVAKTSDGHIIVMHDKTLDRTTNGKGLVKDFTLTEIKALRLRNGTGRTTTQFSVPTLEEAMLVVKGKIKVNLDKADPYFNDVYAILEKTGTIEQAIIKSATPYQELREQFGENLDKMIFMPKIRISNSTKMDSIDSLLSAGHSMYEISFGEDNKELLLKIKAKLEGTSSLIWINTLWESQNAGRCDDIALKDPNGTWGYLIDSLGASVLQTDRPEYMLKYLREKGLK